MHATCGEIITRPGSGKINDGRFSRFLTLNIGCRCCCRPFEHLLYTYAFPVLSLSRPRPILPEYTCTYVAHCGSPLVSIICFFHIVWDRVEGTPPALHCRNNTVNYFVRNVLQYHLLQIVLCIAYSLARVLFVCQIRVRNLTYMQPFSPVFFIAHTNVSEISWGRR